LLAAWPATQHFAMTVTVCERVMKPQATREHGLRWLVVTSCDASVWPAGR
jgi:hypothetical protein